MFLKYQESTKIVVGIYNEQPTTEAGYLVATSDVYSLGDEFENLIKIITVDTNGVVDSTSSIKQAPQAQYLLEQLATKDQQISVLQTTVDQLVLDALL